MKPLSPDPGQQHVGGGDRPPSPAISQEQATDLIKRLKNLNRVLGYGLFAGFFLMLVLAMPLTLPLFFGDAEQTKSERDAEAWQLSRKAVADLERRLAVAEAAAWSNRPPASLPEPARNREP